MSLVPITCPRPQRSLKRKAQEFSESDGHPAKRQLIQLWIDETLDTSATRPVSRSRSDTFLIMSKRDDKYSGGSTDGHCRRSQSNLFTPLTPASMAPPAIPPAFGQSRQSPSDTSCPESVTSQSKKSSVKNPCMESFTSDSGQGGGHKNRTRQPDYRNDIARHGISIADRHTGLPEALGSVPMDIITRTRNSPELNEEQVRRIQNNLAASANVSEPVFNIRFQTTGLLPDFDFHRASSLASDTLFSREPVPHKNDLGIPHVATPKPDFAYGVAESVFSDRERGLTSHPLLHPYAAPTTDCLFPFFTVELKSPSRGGTIWAAENQNAGSGAHSVNSLHTLYEYTKTQRKVELAKTFVFSCCVDYTSAHIYVHWCSDEKERLHVSSYLQQYNFHQPRDVMDFRTTIRNIIEYGVDNRLKEIKSALAEICLDRLNDLSKAQKVRKILPSPADYQ